MLISRSIVSTLKSPVAVNGIVNRAASIMSTPPRVRVSITEKVMHGLIMTAGIMAYPIYISHNLKHYKGSEDE